MSYVPDLQSRPAVVTATQANQPALGDISTIIPGGWMTVAIAAVAWFGFLSPAAQSRRRIRSYEREQDDLRDSRQRQYEYAKAKYEQDDERERQYQSAKRRLEQEAR